VTAVDPTTENMPAVRSRRNVLCGLVVALVAPGALAAACSDDSGSGDTGGDTTGGGTPTGGDSGKGVAAVADIPDGGGLIVDGADGKVLLVRTGQDVKGYNAACTHMGTIVGAPEGGVATCPNHGSQFDAATGAVKKGPATKPLATVNVSVEGDQVVLA
jgi:cytochrome b6-f complex iron-sulfur subunit